MSESLAAFLAGLRGVLLKLGTPPPPPQLAPPAPMVSGAFTAFESAIGQLASAFLPKAVVNPPAGYSPEELLLARAFIVFAHAQLEEYLESVARTRADFAMQTAVAGEMGRVAAALLSFHGDSQCLPGDLAKYKTRHLELAKTFTNHSAQVDRILLSHLKVAIERFNSSIAGNHGVKEASLLRLFAPLAISPLQMDPAWIAAMNAFGSLRGDHAHNGLSTVSSVSDPFAARRQLDELIQGPPGSAGSGFGIFSLRSLDLVLQVH